MAAIELDGVTKRFGDVTALEEVDLTVEEGEVFGFLGPNGAGKSTTINILLDFVRPTEGSASVLGVDTRAESKAIRDRTGVLPEGYDVYERLTGREHLQFVIEAKDADDDPMALLDRVGLDAEDAARNAGGYSKGMTQRLVLAMALVDEPDLLILDEPSSGLDPNGARMMRELVREESERGATVFFSSHILGQVEAVCDTVGILQDGRLIAKDSVDELRDRTEGGTTLHVTLADGEVDAAVEAVTGLDVVSSVSADGGTLAINCESDAKMTILNAIEEAGSEVADFETTEASLEDLFATYTGGER
ncbi:ATP-binding cassette domain-containing protein [Halomicroarcula sp. GCM10025324]|uniref:ABC transporter ATP-binding protein n=1 Tax=Haloarcula TaxID=2237 RepID=UPI0023E8600F|nr:ABC transporter ATP-binding protein [Halomicroarcula sp. ZS-22-S1]